MIKEYSQNRSNVILNFSIKYCDNSQELLQSSSFRKVLKKYVSTLEKEDSLLLEKLIALTSKDVDKDLLELFKLLLAMDKKDVRKLNDKYRKLFRHSELVIEFIEGFYNYWRRLERYALIQSNSRASGIQNVNFIEANNRFNENVITTYRLIEENILGFTHKVYRQLNAGINAGLVLMDNISNLPNAYDSYKNIQMIKSVVLNPPMVMYPKKNTRSGMFEEVLTNPILDLNVNDTHYFCYPAKVGESLAFIYFHRDFMNHGVALSNLFELASLEEYKHKTPDIIYVFGQRNGTSDKNTVYYKDTENGIYVGFANNTDKVDYFGYMKKMILTLHNLRMIDQKALPIHGAMVNITLKNGKSANIAIVGDSGAGKSETLEAFRKLSKKYLKEIKIVFDDMGTFKIQNNKIYGYGTEIGAFVRLDDLETGYAFSAMDRGIFMNPNRVNARLLLPVSTYSDIMRGYKVDLLLYANNYEDKKQVLRQFESSEEAIKVFVDGSRKAKGTTTEKGVVNSYFANPFGPMQRKGDTDLLIHKFFTKLFENNVYVGEIYTKLGLDGMEIDGPEKAAIQIFDWITNRT